MYGAGPSFDMLLDRLHAMGAPAPRFGRVGGEHAVWLNATLPSGTVERKAATLDQAARAILDLDLTAADKDRDAAQKSLT